MADLTTFDFVLRPAAGVGFLGAGVIPREGGGVRGLNTAATLWCSAASGRPALCATGTAVVLCVHPLLRPAGRMIDRVPQRDPDTEGVRATVRLIRDRADETHVRAPLSPALTGDGLAPTGLRVLEPGIRDLHHSSLDTEREATAA
ncbi:MgtC/SapB family protein [Streptomyces shenzhenensis]